MWVNIGTCLLGFLGVDAFLRKANQYGRLAEDRPAFDELAFSILDHYENSYSPESEPGDVVLEQLCSSTAFNVMGYGSQSRYAPKVFKYCREFLTKRLSRLESESSQIISPLLIHGLRHYQLSEWNSVLHNEMNDLKATKLALYSVSQFRKLLRLKNFSLMKLKVPLLKLDRRDVPRRLKEMKVDLQDLDLSAPDDLKPYIRLALQILDEAYGEVHSTAKEALITKMYDKVKGVVEDVKDAAEFINDDAKVKSMGLPLPPYKIPFGPIAKSDSSSQSLLPAASAVPSTSPNLNHLIENFNSGIASQMPEARANVKLNLGEKLPSQPMMSSPLSSMKQGLAPDSSEGDLQPLSLPNRSSERKKKMPSVLDHPAANGEHQKTTATHSMQEDTDERLESAQGMSAKGQISASSAAMTPSNGAQSRMASEIPPSTNTNIGRARGSNTVGSDPLSPGLSAESSSSDLAAVRSGGALQQPPIQRSERQLAYEANSNDTTERPPVPQDLASMQKVLQMDMDSEMASLSDVEAQERRSNAAVKRVGGIQLAQFE